MKIRRNRFGRQRTKPTPYFGSPHWATIASLIETAKLNDVEPLAYLSDILTRIVKGHPNTQIDDLLPWAYSAKPELKAVA